MYSVGDWGRRLELYEETQQRLYEVPQSFEAQIAQMSATGTLANVTDMTAVDRLCALAKKTSAKSPRRLEVANRRFRAFAQKCVAIDPQGIVYACFVYAFHELFGMAWTSVQGSMAFKSISKVIAPALWGDAWNDPFKHSQIMRLLDINHYKYLLCIVAGRQIGKTTLTEAVAALVGIFTGWQCLIYANNTATALRFKEGIQKRVLQIIRELPLPWRHTGKIRITKENIEWVDQEQMKHVVKVVPQQVT